MLGCRFQGVLTETSHSQKVNGTVTRTLGTDALERHPQQFSHDQPQIFGVDDWSYRCGRTYGTVFTDLEHHPVYLLPDRSAHTLAQWLVNHPGASVVSRDRAGAYADGVRQGTPQALQVADRFHLMKNAMTALEQVPVRQHRFLRMAAKDEQLRRGEDHAGTTPTAIDTSVSGGLQPPCRCIPNVGVIVRSKKTWRPGNAHSCAGTTKDRHALNEAKRW